jgi:hypothetical protein
MASLSAVPYNSLLKAFCLRLLDKGKTQKTRPRRLYAQAPFPLERHLQVRNNPGRKTSPTHDKKPCS